MQNNWKALVKPQGIEREDLTPFYGRFIVRPLERGFGITLGSALRRMLLSSLQGAAVVGVKIEGVEHEFSTLHEVTEDITQVILNLKSLDVWLDVDSERTATIDVLGPKTVTGADVIGDSALRVLNPDHVICTVAEGGRFRAELTIKTGKGYVTNDENKDTLPLGVISMDAVFSPVKKVSFNVSDTRVGRRSDFNKLSLDITTNGAVSPEDALAYAAKIVKDQLSVFINFQEIDDEEVQTIEPSSSDIRLNDNLYKSVDELELSVRAANCLENAGIRFIGELVTRSESDMLKTKNFGRKTLNEIKDLLSEMGLHLGMKVEGLDLDKLSDRA